VTSWLRDPSAFAALRAALRKRIAARVATTLPIRAWSVGCSSGEEAYVLAMLINDVLRELGRSDDCMALGTDGNAQAIEQARAGLFDLEGALAQPAAWRERFFTRIGQMLRAQQEVRRRCVFARHDVLRELPFLCCASCPSCAWIWWRAATCSSTCRRLPRSRCRRNCTSRYSPKGCCSWDTPKG